MRASRSGFTMVEMAIVLAIVGLVAGGIITGSKLLQASRIRAVITQTTSYAVALQQFKDQYGQLPGDFDNAVRIWGRADGGTDLTANCAAAATDVGNGRSTCNGNGDGKIHGNEQFRAWQQMANAGLISGSYTGINGANLYNAIPNSNAPAGALKGSVYFMSSFGTYINDAAYFDGNNDNQMIFGMKDPSSSPSNSVMTPKEAYDIDNKVDDGKPAFGYVGTIRGTFANTTGGRSCVAPYGGDVAGTDPYGADPNTSEYRRDEPAILCFLYFYYGYGLDNRGINR